LTSLTAAASLWTKHCGAVVERPASISNINSLPSRGREGHQDKRGSPAGKGRRSNAPQWWARFATGLPTANLSRGG